MCVLGICNTSGQAFVGACFKMFVLANCLGSVIEETCAL